MEMIKGWQSEITHNFSAGKLRVLLFLTLYDKNNEPSLPHAMQIFSRPSHLSLTGMINARCHQAIDANVW